MAITNMTQFEMGGKEEAKVVAAYADTLLTELMMRRFDIDSAERVVTAAIPAIVTAVSGRGR